MLGATHRITGALTGAAYAAALSEDRRLIVIAAIAASATSNGPISPDLDQTRAWRAIPDWAPSWIRRHRGITHWWGLPVLAWATLDSWCPPEAHWTVRFLLLGWASHILGDFIFGKIPLLPWGAYAGAGLKTGGFWETGQYRSRLSALLGRKRTSRIPFGPTRLALTAALAMVVATGGLPAAVHDMAVPWRTTAPVLADPTGAN